MPLRQSWQRGYLYKESGKWKLRFWEDRIDSQGNLRRAKGKPIILGPSAGLGKISKATAQRLQASHAETVNQSSQVRSAMTVREFVGGLEAFTTGEPWGYFVPEYVLVRAASPNTRRDYIHMLDRHILPIIGEMAIGEVDHSHAARLISVKAQRYSPATVRGIRKVLKLVFDHATRANIYHRPNPANLLILPRGKSEPVVGYTWDEARSILDRLPEPIFTMATLSVATSLNGAELCGIRNRRVNLSDRPSVSSDERDVTPAWSIAIREDYTHGVYVDTKTGNRRRNVPIPQYLRPNIAALSEGKAPEQALFLNQRETGPIDMHNITNRLFKRIGLKLGLKVNWHRFRHTNATLLDELEMDPEDWRRMLGHGSLAMTEHYTHPHQRLQLGADAALERLFGNGGAAKLSRTQLGDKGAAVLKLGSLRESSKSLTTKENRREETVSHS